MLKAVLHGLQEHVESKVFVDWLSTILDGKLPTKSEFLKL
jgi:hypothetical protein